MATQYNTNTLTGRFAFRYGKKSASEFCVYGYTVDDTKNLPEFVSRNGGSVLVKVIGNNLPAVSNLSVKFYGEWKNDPVYGPQFCAKSFEYCVPKSKSGLIALFSSPAFPKIGKKTAEKGAAGSDAVRPAAPARKQELPPAAVTAEKKPLTLDNLWRTADETVDWTDAMLHTSSRDGLTEQKKWSFYHRMAPRVLAGDTEAYAEVLTTENPLGDLAEYTAGMVLRTPDAERVECVFECREEHLSQRGEDYLGAVSLRVARDLLAVLPISEVTVTGNLQGREVLKVTYGRSQLLKKNVAFLNPADFARECGAVIQFEET